MLISALEEIPESGVPLVGRGKTISEITQLVSRSRLLTLTGAVGVGKSTLARHIALARRSAFTHGVSVVDLESRDTQVDVPQVMRSVLQPNIDPVRSRRTPRQHADAVGGQKLVLLDNCHAAIDDAAQLALNLLSAERNLRVLAASRQILRIPGELVYTIEPLATPDLASGSATESQDLDDSVRLFVDHARNLNPEFRAELADLATIAEICRQLDGIPAAIERAAAAAAGGQSLVKLSAQVGLGGRARSRRGQALYADLVRSAMAICAPDEARLCDHLSVFRGPFSLSAAEAVSGDGSGEGVLDALTSLVDKSIVLPEAGVDGRESRYFLPKIFQRHGRSKLVWQDAIGTTQARMRDWYRELARKARDEFLTGNQATWIHRLQAELTNIDAVLRDCVRDGSDLRSGLQLATELEPYWPAIADDSGLSWLTEALTLYPENDRTRTKGLIAACRTAQYVGQSELASSLLDELQVALQAHDEPELRTHWVELTAHVALAAGHISDAIVGYEKAHAAFAEIGDRTGTWRTLNRLSFMTGRLGQQPRSSAHAEAARAMVEPAGLEWSRSTTLWLTAYHHWQLRELHQAGDLARTALRLGQHTRDRIGKALCLELLAWIAAAEHRYKAAARLLGAAQAAAGRPVVQTFAVLAADRQSCDRRLTRALGHPAYSVAFERGLAQDVDESVQLVLNSSKHPATSRVEPDTPLTQRELEIARGIALGMTNRQVASSLAVAQRTAEAHLENILMKLNLTSRSQVAAWIAKHDNNAGL